MDGGRSRRAKKVSARMSEVTEEDKAQAARARLDALENDDAGEDAFAAAGSDDEFQLDDSDEETLLGDGKKRKRKKGGGAKRKTRQAASEQRGPRTFAACLEAAELELQALEGQPTYLTAAAGPPTEPPRKWCSVCGFAAPYKCVRCASRFCSRKCLKVHTETRCLKFAI